MIKQIKIFRPETLKDVEPFLAQYPNAQLISAEHFAVDRQTKYILSIGDKKNLQHVPRPSEMPYQIPIIYAVYEIEGDAPEGSATKIRYFSIDDSASDINKFLSAHDVQNIFIMPTAGVTGPLDNYVAGEFCPVPDRSAARVMSHRLVVVYKE